MKKKIALALLASLALTTGAAFAAEASDASDLKINGNLDIRYRDDERKSVAGVKESKNGFKETLTLNISKQIIDNVDFYARFTYQNLSPGLQGYGQDYAGSLTNNYNAAFDALGLKIAQGGWNWTIGTQVLTIGTQGLIYDNGFIGKYALPYAISGAGKLGVVDTSVFYARTNYQAVLGNQDRFYGAAASYAINDKNTVGALVTRWTPGDTGTRKINFYGLDYSYKIDDKLSFVSEYTKSSAQIDNKGYIAGLTYAADNNNKISAKYYRSEGNSQINDKNFGGMGTTPNPNTKGYILALNHTISKTTSASISYDSEKLIRNTTDYGVGNRDRTQVSYNIAF